MENTDKITTDAKKGLERARKRLGMLRARGKKDASRSDKLLKALERELRKKG